MLTLLLTVVSITTTMAVITMPLGCHQVARQPAPTVRTHLRHFQETNETYRLNSRQSIFTLNLTFQGLLYELSIDTGSSDIFIKGRGMDGAPEDKYSCITCLFLNKKIPIAYLDGRLQTYAQNMTVGLGQHRFKQQILVAYHTKSPNYKEMGGIVGLSFQQSARNPSPNFMNTLINNKIIDKYVFGVKLNFRKKQESFITFGGYDRTYIAQGQQIVYHNIPDQNYKYHTRLSKITVGRVQLPIKEGLYDTGNTCISIPEEFNDQILSQMNKNGNQCQYEPEQNNNQFDLLSCRIADFDSLPSFSFHIDDSTYVITKEYYIDKCKQPDENGVRKCDTFLESVRRRVDVLLGDAFFLRYYAVFDIDNRRIGLAKNDDHTTMEDVLGRY